MSEITAVAVVTLLPNGQPARCVVGKLEADNGQLLMVITNDDGYDEFKEVPVPFTGTLKLQALDPNGHSYSYPISIGGHNVTIRVGGEQVNPQDVLLPACVPFSKPSALPTPPTRDEIIDVVLTFQGLVFYTEQFGKLPGFEACLPWLTPADRQVVYAAKHNSASMRVDKQTDTHCIVVIPDGPPLYDEPDQAYSPDKFGPLDWTNGNTVVDNRTTDLIREVVNNGFKSIILYLGGDGDNSNYKIAFQQLDLLYANDDYRTTLYKYCVVIPGWDGVFYGWPLEQIMLFGARFRELFPDGHLGLHYSTGHIPVGEGGDDYKPRPAGGDIQQNPGRMADYDLLIGEFGGTEYEDIHYDSTWQILNRLEEVYIRPADQPAGDDEGRKYYLGTPNPRGRWGHFAMEFDEFASVRCGSDFDGMVLHANNSRAYMKSMGTAFTG